MRPSDKTELLNVYYQTGSSMIMRLSKNNSNENVWINQYFNQAIISCNIQVALHFVPNSVRVYDEVCIYIRIYVNEK